MTDSSTWFVGKSNIKNLETLFKGDPFLINVYHALKQKGMNTEKKKIAKLFIDFLISEEGQKIITNFGKKEYQEAIYNNIDYSIQYNK